uniref:Putative permease n=1 Tax=mine drainage metagenome TaxID=410659 RepID=E6PQD9_9ZZZZ
MREDDDNSPTLPLPHAVQERSASEPTPLLMHVPVNIRSMSLVLLAALASIFVLSWAKAVFIPLMTSLMLSYALSPAVNWLEHRRIPRWLGAALILLTICSAVGVAAYLLSNQATRLVVALPAAVQKFKMEIKPSNGNHDTALETVQKAATQIEKAAGNRREVRNSHEAMRVVVEPSSFNVKDYLWSSTIGLLTLLGQTAAVLFLTYFLIISGDSFRRKLIKLAGPSLSSKKITLQALHEITDQIQRYLQVQIFTSALVAVLTGLALMALGLQNAAVWGIVAGVLNLVPYVGSLITASTSGLVAFLQFGSLDMALVIGGVSLGIHTLVGNLLTPWLTSRSSQLSPVAVFVGLLAWGWLWGVWGLLLGVPILMIVKAVCDRLDGLKPIGEFLGS